MTELGRQEAEFYGRASRRERGAALRVAALDAARPASWRSFAAVALTGGSRRHGSGDRGALSASRALAAGVAGAARACDLARR